MDGHAALHKSSITIGANLIERILEHLQRRSVPAAEPALQSSVEYLPSARFGKQRQRGTKFLRIDLSEDLLGCSSAKILQRRHAGSQTSAQNGMGEICPSFGQ